MGTTQHVVHQHDHGLSSPVPPQPTNQARMNLLTLISVITPESRPPMLNSPTQPGPTRQRPIPLVHRHRRQVDPPCSSSLSQRAVPVCSSSSPSMLLAALSSPHTYLSSSVSVPLFHTHILHSIAGFASLACFLMSSSSIQFQHGHL